MLTPSQPLLARRSPTPERFWPVNDISVVRLMRPDDDIQQVIERTRAAVNQLMDGGPDAWLAVCSQRSDATLFGDSGGHARGWEQLETRYRRASARRAG